MKQIFVFVFFGAAAVIAVGQTAPSGNAQEGKRVFLKDGCYECHGYAGQGGRSGARVAHTALTAPALIRYVRRPAGQMPSFDDKVISDQELTDIWAYLKSLPAAKKAKDIPLLEQLLHQ
jgi:mono/diheme cytochrome c family protein